ncbi:MerR family glutamine synthetase transcriptional repressor [Virgibacillus natechei]|uniref:MerR family glutamine synthetase transcriptional repressor n=1 Tax=Virgibacillus natechei TaxID=1216297 RepID=A0ABS4IAS1_9BACI|nr:MerR family transcriptional regulator [Virgibacillus natechei]MBP1968017.1 MerR family glutamine synthetase transcriptional repressor [Virgibacillus natechei]UZD14700.1 MerR family transcriptional regulator [Virgibacillus natechei]
MNDKDRRSMPLFGISIVRKLTDLTARQIRYYEEHNLIRPERTSGNHRLFSFNDVDRLLEIKNLLDKRHNVAGIKLLFDTGENKKVGSPKQSNLSDKELRKILRNELVDAGRYGKTSLRQGELSGFLTHRKA